MRCLGVVLALLTSCPCQAATASPPWAWQPGEAWFRVGGQPSFVLGRNATGYLPEHFDEALGWAAAAGERLVRLHLTTGNPAHAAAGALDEAWAARWEAVFTQAAQRGLVVVPVLDVWSDWNDGSRGEPWHRWHVNAYNQANGGPARAPAELLTDSPCRRLWLRALDTLVRRWAARPEIVAWELFSELDLVSGASEAAAADFVAAAAATVRAADAGHRPTTASLSGCLDWPQVFGSAAVDLVQVHPYAEIAPYHGDLARQIVDVVRQRRERYRKPLLLGESGLYSGQPGPGSPPTLPQAPAGLRQACWAAAVSGAMCGRMLWWEDGYDRYGGLDLRTRARDLAAPVARFVAGVDYTGLEPLTVEGGDRVWGAALAQPRLALVWLRDLHCVPPLWPAPPVSGATVQLRLPGGPGTWHLAVCATDSGEPVSTARLTAGEGAVSIALPTFQGSLALRLQRLP